MNQPLPPAAGDPLAGIFPGDSELAALMRAFDWAQTPLGPAPGWPLALKTCVRLMLTSRQPMWLGWGEQLIYLYNDAYKSIIGGKHPWALGRPTAEVWREIWDAIGPRIRTTMEGREGTYDEALLLIMERHGYQEETYYTFSYSPVPDDAGGVGGLFCANTDDTARIIGERQVSLLRDLAAGTMDAHTVADACTLSARSLETNPRDLPFALIYLVDPDQRTATLAGAANLPDGHPAAPKVVSLDGAAPWPLAEALRSNAPCLVAELGPSLGALPSGAWERPPQQAVALPIASLGQAGQAGVLVAGLNPYRLFDDDYRGFLSLVAGQIGAAIANARAYEEAAQRAEALAALDRAKTAFFSEVSHEFRTPLTLLLGPLEDLLGGAAGPLSAAQQTAADVAHRNALRLLRLVNTLLDFARLEAGRTDAVYERVDLAALTADLASAFRSAIERAGLRLVVDCPPLPAEAEVYVDRDLWEKVVLNLLSNAFKFTLAGEIAVRLRWTGDQAELTVADTGVGIPAAELPHLFERFHRVRGSAARTQEGSGIGLALVAEVVRLHGGSISVTSELGAGTTFTITLPAGTAHLPAERVNAARGLASTALGAAPYVEEAARWDGGAVEPEAGAAAVAVEGAGVAAGPGWGRREARILVADDNADMRDYLTRLLGAHWRVQSVADGRAALAAAQQEPPDLVLSDVMMPGLDGFGLLRALRAEERTAGVPVVLLSARAGEEARLEGLAAGADDYLVKPFSARELVARVGAHLELARVRAEAAERERRAREEVEQLAAERAALLSREQAARAEAEAAARAKDEFLALLSHELRTPLTPILGFTALLRRGDASPERLALALETIERSARTQARLVEDLLDVSRILAGKLALQWGQVMLLPVVEAALEGIRPVLAAKEVTLAAELDRGVGPVWGDADRLGQVLNNLLANAAKFTPPGGSVTVQLGSDTGVAWVRVTDTGVGIPSEFLPHVFERFRQADVSTTRAHGGLGLGLSIAGYLVEQQGGTLTADSEGVGRGATFTLRLPLAEHADSVAPAALRAGAAEDRPLAGVPVVIVEDDADTRALVQIVLEEAGAVVTAAGTSSEGLAAVAAAQPAVVVADLGLPGEDGYAFLAKLQAQAAGGGVPVLALTAYAGGEDRARALAAGFAWHLSKPIDGRILVDTVAALAGRPVDAAINAGEDGSDGGMRAG